MEDLMALTIRIQSPKSGGKWQDRPVDPAWWDKLFSNKASHDDLIVQK